eukprot:7572361-Heterocapsa_arctica.AAC.1
MLMVENIRNYRQVTRNIEYETGIFDKGRNDEKSSMKENWGRGQVCSVKRPTPREQREHK